MIISTYILSYFTCDYRFLMQNMEYFHGPKVQKPCCIRKQVMMLNVVGQLHQVS